MGKKNFDTDNIDLRTSKSKVHEDTLKYNYSLHYIAN